MYFIKNVSLDTRHGNNALVGPEGMRLEGGSEMLETMHFRAEHSFAKLQLIVMSRART